MATELSIRKQKTKFRMRYVLAHDLLDARVVVYAVVLCVSASVQLTRGGVGDGSRQGPAFSRWATSSPPSSASLYHIMRGPESRGHWEERAAHHWAAAAGFCFNIVSPFYCTASIVLCWLPAWCDYALWLKFCNFVWALLEQMSGCAWPVRPNVSMCVS
jgi:hypothetical protein